MNSIENKLKVSEKDELKAIGKGERDAIVQDPGYTGFRPKERIYKNKTKYARKEKHKKY